MKGKIFRKISYVVGLICVLCIPFIAHFVKSQGNKQNNEKEEAYSKDIYDDKKYPVNEMSISEVAKLVGYEAEAVRSRLKYECAASLISHGVCT